MSQGKIKKKVLHFATELIKEKGYIAPIDLLIKMKRVTPKQVEDWRFGRIPYLERVTIGNLAKMNSILSVVKGFAELNHLNPSRTVYKSWGKGRKRILRFSKSGSPYMEERYSTHYITRKNYGTDKVHVWEELERRGRYGEK